jgi:hypothetical protein
MEATLQQRTLKPKVVLHRRVLAAAVLAASGLLVSSCGVSSLPTGTIKGQLFGSGGPAPGQLRPFNGQVTATGANGKTYATTVPSDGRFVIHLPSGTYSLTGSSPQFDAGHSRCLGRANVTIAANQTVTENVDCPMR